NISHQVLTFTGRTIDPIGRTFTEDTFRRHRHRHRRHTITATPRTVMVTRCTVIRGLTATVPELASASASRSVSRDSRFGCRLCRLIAAVRLSHSYSRSAKRSRTRISDPLSGVPSHGDRYFSDSRPDRFGLSHSCKVYGILSQRRETPGGYHRRRTDCWL